MDFILEDMPGQLSSLSCHWPHCPRGHLKYSHSCTRLCLGGGVCTLVHLFRERSGILSPSAPKIIRSRGDHFPNPVSAVGCTSNSHKLETTFQNSPQEPFEVSSWPVGEDLKLLSQIQGMFYFFSYFFNCCHKVSSTMIIECSKKLCLSIHAPIELHWFVHTQTHSYKHIFD